jgi:ribosomal protein L7Ae-like RNA K-turn-binding protein
MSSADGPGVSEALAMAAKAGQVVSGFSKVEGAIEGRQAAALIHARDGAADGIRKLNAKLAPQDGKIARNRTIFR